MPAVEQESELSFLNTWDIAGVQKRMALNTEPNRESAAVLIPGTADYYTLTPGSYDRTLSRQLDDLHYSSGLVTHGLTDQPPQAYLFTEYSAVPAADAVRGYLQAAGRSIPAIGTIAANRTQSKEFFRCHTRLASPAEEEIERLRSVTKGLDHVCVVDQYVATGLTLQYAGALLEHAGVRVRTAIRGNWYNNADVAQDNIDTKAVSSKHAAIMKNIGKLAWQYAI